MTITIEHQICFQYKAEHVDKKTRIYFRTFDHQTSANAISLNIPCSTQDVSDAFPDSSGHTKEFPELKDDFSTK